MFHSPFVDNYAVETIRATRESFVFLHRRIRGVSARAKLFLISSIAPMHFVPCVCMYTNAKNAPVERIRPTEHAKMSVMQLEGSDLACFRRRERARWPG